MPRRELLTPTERLQLLAFPEDAGELIRVLTLSKADIAFVQQHRGDHNRFGIAVLMAYLRYPGRTLAKDEKLQIEKNGSAPAAASGSPQRWSLGY
jgi:hypothetical protein